jgi:predicted DNA-binding transcriptional regulator AlpA
MRSRAHLPDWPRAMTADLAAEYVGLSTTSIQDLRRRKEFPAPVPLTKGRVAWLRETLDKWLDDKAGNAGGALDDWPDA